MVRAQQKCVAFLWAGETFNSGHERHGFYVQLENCELRDARNSKSGRNFRPDVVVVVSVLVHFARKDLHGSQWASTDVPRRRRKKGGVAECVGVSQRVHVKLFQWIRCTDEPKGCRGSHADACVHIIVRSSTWRCMGSRPLLFLSNSSQHPSHSPLTLNRANRKTC